jgi:peptidoglycan hydrolase-like protein with peptidoglycan-binding domain
MPIRLLPAAALTALLFLAAPAAAAPAPAAPRCGGDTARVQRALTAAGYPAGPVDGCTGAPTRAGVQAFQLAHGLAPDGVVGPATRRALVKPRRLLPVSAAPGTHVEIDLARQLLMIVRDGKATAVYAASSGMPGFRTPTGTFRVAYQQRSSWSYEYRTSLPFASYFVAERGIAVHAGVVPGRPASHGCVRVPKPFAAAIYRSMPAGTRVIVR